MLEWRSKFSLGGIVLYVISTIYIAYQSFTGLPNISTWNALFWIIVFFTAINAVAKSFMQESGQSEMYLYTLANPRSILLSKIIYNMIMMWILGAISLFFFVLFLGGDLLVEANASFFLVALLIGSSGFAAILTMISAIAAKTSNNLGVMAILGFPVALPFLLSILKISGAALDGMPFDQHLDFTMVAMLINVIVIALAYLLFPYLWRE